MNSKIIIAKPCHENWNKMTPEEQGRHCGACNKVVQDFTKMNTEEIIGSLKKKEGEVCGRIGVNKLTPANQKQKIWFRVNSILMRKAVYPVMALLGVTLIAKKANAQVGDYLVKGKMDVRDYHTTAKKVNVVIKTNSGTPLENATVRIISGLNNQRGGFITDAHGRVTMNIRQEELTGDAIEVEITAPGYDTRTSTIKLIKDIQTVEIKMDEEIMIMGEMSFVPDEPIEKATIVPQDTTPVVKVDVCKCPFKEIKELPLIDRSIIDIQEQKVEVLGTIDSTEIIEKSIENEISPSGFTLYPNPSTDFVTIESNGKEVFNLDIFDANGKKIHAIINVNERYLLDLTKYAAGTYFALITVDGKAVETKKLIVGR